MTSVIMTLCKLLNKQISRLSIYENKNDNWLKYLFHWIDIYELFLSLNYTKLNFIMTENRNSGQVIKLNVCINPSYHWNSLKSLKICPDTTVVFERWITVTNTESCDSSVYIWKRHVEQKTTIYQNVWMSITIIFI